MLDIRPVKFSEHIDQIGHLLRAHLEELNFDFPMALSTEMYQAMENAGVLFGLAAFVENRVVGYCTVAITPHPFNPAILSAIHDLLYVSKEHRGTGIGKGLIQAAEREAKARNVKRMWWGTHVGTPLTEQMIANGYTPIDVMVSKAL